MSLYKLSDDQNTVLAKGLNYLITLDEIPIRRTLVVAQNKRH